jgi:hypothetical protein
MNRLISIGVFLLAAGLVAGCEKEKKIGTDPTKTVEVSLASVNTGNGLQPLASADGRTAAASVGGSACRTAKSTTGVHAYFYFAVDPKIKSPDLKNGKMVVEYFDSGKGELRMQYDGSNTRDDGRGAYTGSGVVEKMSGELVWKTAIFPFHDAVFKNRQNGRADFRIEALRTTLSVRKLTLVRE